MKVNMRLIVLNINISDELDEIFHEQLNRLIVMTMNASGPFRAGFAQEWYNKYQQMMKNRGTKNDKLKK